MMNSVYVQDIRAGDQIVLLPEWAFKTLEKHGKIEDVADFKKVRHLFNNDEIIALDAFSEYGLKKILACDNTMYTRSLGYIWCFPGEAGVPKNLDADDHDAWVKLTDRVTSISGKEIKEQLLNELVLSELKSVNPQLKDISQFYSVYSSSKNFIVLVVKPGIMGKTVISQLPQLRLAVARSILGKLEAYYELAKIAETSWFGMYLTALEEQSG